MDMKTKPNDRTKGRRTLAKAAVIAAAAFALFSAASFPLKTVFYKVTSDKVKARLRIAQISDLHSCAYGSDMSVLLDAVDKQSPDIIVLTGDIYDDTEDNSNTRTFLKAAAKKYPCYYIAGNHEFKTPKWKEYLLEAQSFGVVVLQGENVTLWDITICGAARSADGSLSWEEAVKSCAESACGYSVLLAHFPEAIDYYRSFGKFDLILCGHAHGGQWRIPFSRNGIYAPGQGLFPKYSGGRFDFADCTMIVSRGLSRTKEGIPRILNNPELVIIDILPEEKEE